MYIGYESYAYNDCRSLFKISVPELASGDMVVGGYLHLYLHSYSFDSSDIESVQINAHAITESWSESTVTWNNKPNIQTYALDYSAITRSNEWKSFDITRAVKSWYEEDLANNGIMIKAAEEKNASNQIGARAIFWSENANSTEDGYPFIAIDYRSNKGLESYWSFTNTGVGNSTAYVDDYSGNLVYELPVFSGAGLLAPIDITAYFNSYCANRKLVAGKNNSSRTTPGRGFRLNVQQTLLPSSQYGLTGDAAENYPYVYTDQDGTEHYIKKSEDEDGLGLEFTDEPDLTATYQITDKSDTSYYFNSKGNLGIIEDADGNRITIHYKDASTANNLEEKNRISKITDGSGHTYTFDYYEGTDVSEGDYIKSITDSAGRKVNFTTSGGLLEGIDYPGGSTIDIVYCSNSEDHVGYIDKITSNSSYRVNFDYTAKTNGRRVKSVREYGLQGSTYELGSHITFDRTKYNTTVLRSQGVDGIHYNDVSGNGNDDIVTTLQFDNYARVVSQQLSYGSGTAIGAQTFGFSSAGGQRNNKVTSTGSTSKNTVNLIKGGSGESTEEWTVADVGTLTHTNGTSTTTQHTGKKSLYLNNTAVSTTGARSYYRQIFANTSFTIGKYYTLSAYVKAEALTAHSDAEKTGAYVQISACDTNGDEILTNISPVIKSETNENIDNGWQRLNATLKVPENTSTLRVYLVLRNTVGKVYFDSIQLEQGYSPNNLNLLKNSSFESTSSGVPVDWNPVGNFTASNSVTTTDYSRHGEKSLRINGVSNQSSGLSQMVDITGKGRDTYILSGWARGYPVNTTFHTTGDDATPQALFEFAVRVSYKDEDGNTYTQYKDSAKFNTTVTGWQFTLIPVVLKYTGGESGKTYTPTAIMVMPRFNRQANFVCFDHIMLTKEVASTYKYDKEGNLISTAANSEQEYNVEYDDYDNVKSSTDALGNKSYFTYSTGSNKHRMESSETPKGVETHYTYTADGNVKGTETKNASGSLSLTTSKSYTSNGAYLSSETDSSGKTTQYSYNTATGALTSTIDPKGHKTTNTYNDSFTELQKVRSFEATTDSSGNTTYSQINAVGYVYDSAKRLTDIKFAKKLSDSDYANETYSFTYDIFGNVKTTKVGTNTLQTNTYGANNGLLQSSTYGNSDVIEYTYNDLGLVTDIRHKDKNPNTGTTGDKLAFENTYSANGTLVNHIDRYAGLRYDYTYDSLGRNIVTNIRTTGENDYVGSTVFGYDLRGNVTSIRNEIGGRAYTQTYSYSEVKDLSDSDKDAEDNLPTKYRAIGVDTLYSYDGINRLTKKLVDLDDEKTSVDLVTRYTYKTTGSEDDGKCLLNQAINKFNYSPRSPQLRGIGL